MKLRIRDLVFSAEFGEVYVVYDLVNDQILEFSGEAAAVWKRLILEPDGYIADRSDENVRHLIAIGLITDEL